MDMSELDRQALRMMLTVFTEEELDLCDCPECEPHMLEDAWNALQSVPAYIERFKLPEEETSK